MIFSFKMGLPISSCPDFKGQVCPSRIVKFSTHLHLTAAPKAQENLTKWGWCCQRAAELGSHRSKPRYDAGPSRQKPCSIPSPTAASQRRDLPTAGGSQGWRCSRRKGEPASFWEGAHEPSGFAGGISPHSVLPPHPSSVGITGSLGWWLLLVWL